MGAENGLCHQEVNSVFEWLVEEEIPRRRNLILERARQSGGAPRAAKQQFIEAFASGEADPFPALVVFVDEFAEIMLAGGSALSSSNNASNKQRRPVARCSCTLCWQPNALTQMSFEERSRRISTSMASVSPRTTTR